MRRATRSSSGRPTSPDAELMQEPQERNTRSRELSGRPVSPDAESVLEPEERATRSRKPSEDLVVLELPRITRTGKRSGSGKSPEPPKLSPRGGRNTEGGHKHEKRGLSPAEEPSGETSSKRRRRSGRLAEGDVEKDKQETQEKDEKDDSEKRDKFSEKKGKSPREKKHEAHLKEKEDKEVKTKVKDTKQQVSVMKEQQKLEESAPAAKELSGTPRRRTRSGRQGIDGDEESSVQSHQLAQQDIKHDHSEKDDGDKGIGEPTSKHQKSKDHSRSSRSTQDKDKGDIPKLRSPPRSPEKSRKAESSKVELQKINLDLGELTVKTSSKPSSRGALSPPLRMSPRRARQPSGQKSSDDPGSAESKDTQDKNSCEEITSTASDHKELAEDKTISGIDKTEDQGDKRKKSIPARRDICKDFDEPKEIPKSPTRTTRARKEEDVQTTKEDTLCNDDGTLANPSMSLKVKKSRSPVKSPRDSPAVSPRKGLRSGRAPAVDGAPDLNGAQEQEQVNVVAMETEPIPPPISTGTSSQKEGIVGQQEEADAQPLPEADPAPTVSELLSAEKQAKEVDDVTEISDEVAAKIREWRVQEEESVGFQGEEWYAEEVDEGEPFYYESDHMALKGNKDYRMLLRTITTLEAQRKQAVKDLDKLVTAQREALRNPLKFVHKLQKKDTLHLPSPQRIVLLPEIPWGRYLGHADSKELIQGLSHQTRASLKQKDLAEDPGAGTSTSSGPKEDQTMEEDEKNKSVIRGRLWDESKPDTFNRLWTVGEQKRLEDLLLKYPSEEVEARRWEKIAKDLGNRTRHQVASRVQKYFIKLGKAGLPIPGRMPNMATYTAKKPSQRRFVNPYNRLTVAPSTFLQSIRAPVLMNEEDDALDYEMDYDADSIMEEDDIPSELKDSEEYNELVRLKKLRNVTLKQQTDMSHVGYSCDGCGVAPIVGVRWHCVNCPMEISTDLCQSCVNDDFQSDIHRSSHRMDPVQPGQSAGFIDSDYTSFTGTSGDYNYLDPNYSPAVL